MNNTVKKGTRSIGPVAAGFVGTAVVAGAAAAVALSSKENRKKAVRMLKDLRKRGMKLTEQAVKTVGELKKEAVIIGHEASKRWNKEKKILKKMTKKGKKVS